MAKSGKLRPGSAKALSKEELVVNLTGVKAGQRRPKIKEGNYRARLNSAEITKTKEDAKSMVLWKFGVLDGAKYESQGIEIWYRTVLQENTLWDLRRVLTALGVKVRDATMKMNLSKLVGRTCGIEVVDGDEYRGKIASEVNDIFPEAMLEEDEEEDVEEYEEYEEDEEEADEEEPEEDEDEEEDWEDEDDEDEVDEEEEELDLEAMDLSELKEVAEEVGVSVKPPKGKQRISKAVLRRRITEALEAEEEDEDEVDLDEDEL